MLTIREKQMAVFAEVETKKFVDRVVVHLNKFFPTQCADAGQEQLRETVQYGIRRAGAYGITSERDVYKYIDLMVVLGRDFDTDKEFPWAGEILNSGNTPSQRMWLLVRTADEHLART